jgi:5-formyltetrahydrofolate cyclo-ligase
MMTPMTTLGAHPQCFLHELDPKGVVRPDSRLVRDVIVWRKAERERLINARLELSADYRAAQTSAIASDLNRLILAASGTLVSVCWPIKAEPDCHRRSASVAAQCLKISGARAR